MSSDSSSASSSDESGEEEPPPKVFREWKGLDLRFETIYMIPDPEDTPDRFFIGNLVPPSEGRKFYAVGEDRALNKQIFVLDLSQNDPQWTLLSRIPEPRILFRSIKVGNKIVIVGGIIVHGPVPNILCYDIDRNEWSSVAAPHIPFCRGAAALNSHEFLCAKNDLQRNNLELGKYNVVEGTSEKLSVRMKGGVVKQLVNIGDQKVVAFMRCYVRGHSDPPCRPLKCYLIDVSADKLVRLPPLPVGPVNNTFFSLAGVTVRNFLIVAIGTTFEYGGFDVSFRLLDLERPSLGWHTTCIDGLEESHFDNRIEELVYLGDEKCILAFTKEEVRKLDLSAVFETGTFKYKATIPRFLRKEDPDGLLPYILAQGNALTQPFLNYQVVRSRMDILCSVQPRSRKRPRIEAAQQDADAEEEGRPLRRR